MLSRKLTKDFEFDKFLTHAVSSIFTKNRSSNSTALRHGSTLQNENFLCLQGMFIVE